MDTAALKLLMLVQGHKGEKGDAVNVSSLSQNGFSSYTSSYLNIFASHFSCMVLGHCVSAFVWAADSKSELIREQAKYCGEGHGSVWIGAIECLAISALHAVGGSVGRGWDW